MALISSSPLSNPAIVDAVDLDTILTATATEFEWTSSDGVHIRLTGNFVYSAGTTLDTAASTVTNVVVDVDFNGAVDLLVDFGFSNNVVGDLTSGSTTTFRDALFAGADIGVLDGTLGPGALAPMELDAFLPSGSSYFGDSFTLRGSGYVVGDDNTAVTGVTGGADALTVDRTNDTNTAGVYGDFLATSASFLGGDDVIEDIGTTSTGMTTFVGDLYQLALVFPATVTGGNDSLIGENANALLIGDIQRITQPDHTILCGNDSIVGGSGNDTLVGDVDTMVAGADNNAITGGGDTLQGGEGNDYLAGDVRTVGVVPSNNTITGGDDLLQGGAGQDSIFGDLPSEDLYNNANTIIGGNDTLIGDEGNDLLNGGSGNDTLNGGADDDTLIGAWGDDRIVGSSGIDTVDFSDSFAAISVSLNSLGNGLATGEGTDSLFGIENLIGSKFDDTLGGGSGDNIIEGGNGDDSLSGGGGRDTLSYSDTFADLAVDLTAQGTAQTIGIAQGTDTFTNFEVVWTASGNDTVTVDTFSDADGVFVFDGGDGVDRLVMAANGLTSTVELGVNTVNFENVTGSSEGDSIEGDSGNNNLQGRGGDDTIAGRGGNDIVSGGNGEDVLSLGEDGGGVLRGEGGADYIFVGGGGHDISGGTGDDFILGGTGDDTIRGQGDSDTISGFDGNDNIFGGSGADSITGGNGDDSILGQGNNDTLNGGFGDDTLVGAAGADSLLGFNDNDSLTGGTGADTLEGGTGNDTMNGGTQSDTFVFAENFDTDRINAYEQGLDRLELDLNLWDDSLPGLTEQQVIDVFGSLNPAGNILTLDFGDGDVLEVQNAAGIVQSTLGLDVTIINYGT